MARNCISLVQVSPIPNELFTSLFSSVHPNLTKNHGDFH